MQNLKIDGERLWGELMETAQIGGTPKADHGGMHKGH